MDYDSCVVFTNEFVDDDEYCEYDWCLTCDMNSVYVLMNALFKNRY